MDYAGEAIDRQPEGRRTALISQEMCEVLATVALKGRGLV